MDISSSYHEYYRIDFYSLNDAFGSDSDLQILSSALHEQGMYLVVSGVLEHFASLGPVESIGYASYLLLVSAEYFHPFCLIDPVDYDNNREAVEQVR